MNEYLFSLGGQTATSLQKVTVKDTQAPTIITCVPPQTLTVGAGGAVALPDLTLTCIAIDNCGK